MKKRDLLTALGFTTGAGGIAFGAWSYFHNRPGTSSNPPKKTPPAKPKPPDISVSGLQIYAQSTAGGTAQNSFGQGTLVNVPERWSFAFIQMHLTNLSTHPLELVMQAHLIAPSGKTILSMPPSADHSISIPGRTTQTRRLNVPSSYLPSHVFPNAAMKVLITIKDANTGGVKTLTFDKALFARPF